MDSPQYGRGLRSARLCDLVDDVEKIFEAADTFKKEVVNGKFEPIRDHISDLSDMLETLEEMFDGKEEILKGVE